ncbi:MAG TPA: antitoxin [Gammaproteobacteria bacterium]|nr:antitoxin [Gammaproteobacteria bacterium]
MQTKLTLRLEDELIQQAKSYARKHGKSLSQVVADYFGVLTEPHTKNAPPPITRSLIGVIESSDVDVEDYKRHLEEKYL